MTAESILRVLVTVVAIVGAYVFGRYAGGHGAECFCAFGHCLAL